MEALQLWFAPVLWIIGTITTMGLFIRFCKPIWAFFQLPKQLTKTVADLDTKITDHFEEIDERLTQFETDIRQMKEFEKLSRDVQLNLLLDRLVQGHACFSTHKRMTNEAYRSFCAIYEAYEKHGGNGYGKSVMDQIHELFKNQAKIKPKE